MPNNLETRVEGDVAYVEPIEAGGSLEAAITAVRDVADNPRQIRTFTGRRGLGLRLPLTLARRAGLVDGSTGTTSSTSDAPSGATPRPELIAEPPRSGSGSGVDTWRGFLLTQSVEFDKSITRAADLRAVWDASPQKAARDAAS